MRQKGFFSDDSFDDFDPDARRRFFGWFRRPGHVCVGCSASEYVADVIGDGLLAIELLRSGQNRGSEIRLVVSYGRLLRVGNPKVRNSPAFREALSLLSIEWERRGSSLAREAAKQMDPRSWIDRMHRLTCKGHHASRMADRFLDELDALELVYWAVQDGGLPAEFERKLQAALRAFERNLHLFLPAVDLAKSVAYLAGKAKGFEHDKALVATLAKFRTLLLESAMVARGSERLMCVKLARQLPV